MHVQLYAEKGVDEVVIYLNGIFFLSIYNTRALASTKEYTAFEVAGKKQKKVDRFLKRGLALREVPLKVKVEKNKVRIIIANKYWATITPNGYDKIRKIPERKEKSKNV